MHLTPQITDVHIVFKTHLDVGFSDLAANVVDLYFSRFIPAVFDLSSTLRQAGGPERFIWTTGSWLIYTYLEQASPVDRARMEEAIRAGDIVWHGLPFTTHSEFMDASLYEEGLRLSRELDRRFGKQTIAAKMTDVPGHTRGIVPLLAAAGIEFLHIGVNSASTPPDVPPVFVWQDPRGANIVVMYHKGGYGGLMVVPGMAEALVVAYTDDNHGPQSAQDVIAIFREMAERFPGATVHASTLDAYARALRGIKPALPVITQEIGDTWIHGVGTDPGKVAQFRELSRLRRRWLASGQVKQDGIASFSRALLMVPEHTWGLDDKTHLADYSNYSAAQFRSVRSHAAFKFMEASWSEQRAYLSAAVAALGQSPEAIAAMQALDDLSPRRPELTGYERIADPATRFETAQLTVGLDPEHGALAYLQDRRTGRRWASPRHLVGLLRYQTFSASDYERYWSRYVVNKRSAAIWARPDQTKPGLAQASPEHCTWLPRLVEAFCRHDDQGYSLVLQLALPEDCSSIYGAPRELFMEIFLPHADPSVHLTVQWFDKPATRLPEALWLSFNPMISSAQGWTMDKMGQLISPLDVVRNGNRKLHAVDTGISYADGRGSFVLDTLDAPLIAPGEPSLLDFNNRQPALRKGMHVNLYNNVWGTNFPLWYDEDARFRFVLRLHT